MKRISPIFLGLLAAAIVGGVLLGVGSTNLVLTIGAILLVFGGWAVSLCLHEFGHAYIAHKGGDWAVAGKGYLTLDPRRYTDPVLSILLPLLFVAVGGIPLPGGAVWINHHALRNKRVESSVSIAGPGANLIIGLILGVVVSAMTASGFLSPLAATLSFLAVLQILAFLINILPIPGLDGWGVIEPWLSYKAQQFGAQVRPYAPLALFVVIIAIPGASNVLYDISEAILNLFGNVSDGVGYGQGLALPWLR